MKVREAVDGDWTSIWPIWRSIVRTGETYDWSPDTTEEVARRVWMVPPPWLVFVVEDVGGIVLGTAKLGPNREGLGDHVANASFMVDPLHAGRGIGRFLGQAIIERAREMGFRAMQFNAVVAVNEPAIRLWKSLGFTVVGTIPQGFRHARLGLVDLHLMYQRLDAADNADAIEHVDA
jgi:L-amino acid N-acyltransferase YncA